MRFMAYGIKRDCDRWYTLLCVRARARARAREIIEEFSLEMARTRITRIVSIAKRALGLG
jgi:hypothetical protein